MGSNIFSQSSYYTKLYRFWLEGNEKDDDIIVSLGDEEEEEEDLFVPVG